VRLLSVKPRAILSEVVPSLFAAAVMAVALIFVERAIDSPWPALLAGGAAGAVTYFAAIAVVAPESLRYLRTTMFPATAPEPEAAVEEAMGEEGPAEKLTGTRRGELLP
jgi:hypothetical protein